MNTDGSTPHPPTGHPDHIDHARLITLSAASHLLRGRRGKSPSLWSMRRWCNPKRGWTGPDGNRIFLRSVKVGGEILLLPEWIEDFEQARIAAGTRHIEYNQQRAAAVQSPRQRIQSQREASEQMDRFMYPKGKEAYDAAEAKRQVRRMAKREQQNGNGTR